MPIPKCYFIGVDVGTRSVRAALFSHNGKLLRTQISPISIFCPQNNFFEQSSKEIWDAVCGCVKKISENVDISMVKGIGFDATCSLVVLDKNFCPVPISGQDETVHDVIMWMDHRAHEETAFINCKQYEVLKYVGGKISIEMQMPKLLWLKKYKPKCWELAKHFFDLPDYLTFKATGNTSRSHCSLTTKWTYHPVEAGGRGWDESFITDIGLKDILEDSCSKIGNEVMAPGESSGVLLHSAASELGLTSGIPVGVSLIDAYAGGLALLTAGLQSEEEMSGRLALICGTSTCHLCVSKQPIFCPGIWGPYINAIIPNLWVNEPGQSATGSLLDYVLLSHPAIKLCPERKDIYEWLELLLEDMVREEKVSDVSLLCKDIHLYPDFHGNRSPLADASLKGMISGLDLDTGSRNLALLYLATVQALAYGNKDIVEQLILHGHRIHNVLMCGGLSKSRLCIQIHADVLGLPVMTPDNRESVLLGAAMLGASASKFFGPDLTLQQVAMRLGGDVDTCFPNVQLRQFHLNKYRVYQKMRKDQLEYRKIMKM